MTYIFYLSLCYASLISYMLLTKQLTFIFAIYTSKCNLAPTLKSLTKQAPPVIINTFAYLKSGLSGSCCVRMQGVFFLKQRMRVRVILIFIWIIISLAPRLLQCYNGNFHFILQWMRTFFFTQPCTAQLVYPTAMLVIAWLVIHSNRI